MTTRKIVPKKPKHDTLKNQNYYGVFNHMIEDNITYLAKSNSTKSKIIGWLIYAWILILLTYIFFTS